MTSPSLSPDLANPEAPDHPRPVVLMAMGCVVAIAWIMVRLHHSLPLAGSLDYPIFADYARQFLGNGMLYDRDLGHYEPNAGVYKFPPLSGAILVCALRAGLADQSLITTAAWLQLAGFAGSICWLALVLLPGRRWLAGSLSVGIVVAMLPTLEENILRLQLEPALLLLSVLAAISIRYQRFFLAGCMIGIATMLKIYPVMAMLLFVVDRQFRAFAGFGCAVAVANVFTLAILGPAEHLFYITRVLPVLLQENPMTNPENIAISRLMLLADPGPALLKIPSRLILLAFPCMAAGMLRSSVMQPGGLSRQQITVLAFSLFIPFTLAGMTNTLWNYQLLLALPLTVMACLLLDHAASTHSSILSWPMAGLLFILINLHITAAMTVDDIFYELKLAAAVFTVLDRILLQLLVILVGWQTFRYCRT